MIQILFVSLGCDKNLVDSEVMLGLLQEKGYIITNEEKRTLSSSTPVVLSMMQKKRALRIL